MADTVYLGVATLPAMTGLLLGIGLVIAGLWLRKRGRSTGGG